MFLLQIVDNERGRYKRMKKDETSKLITLITNWWNRAYKVKKIIVNNQVERIFKKNCMKALRYTIDCLGDLEVPFFLGHGTLLGVIRDNHLIIHDQDLDISIQENNQEKKNAIREYLIKEGYRCIFEFSVERIGIVQQTFRIYGIRVDIDYLFTYEEHDHSYLIYNRDSVVMITTDHVKKIENKEFNEIKVPIPANPEIYLEQVYGERWRVPDPNYKYWDNDRVANISNKGITKTGRQIAKGL